MSGLGKWLFGDSSKPTPATPASVLSPTIFKPGTPIVGPVSNAGGTVLASVSRNAGLQRAGSVLDSSQADTPFSRRTLG